MGLSWALLGLSCTGDGTGTLTVALARASEQAEVVYAIGLPNISGMRPGKKQILISAGPKKVYFALASARSAAGPGRAS